MRLFGSNIRTAVVGVVDSARLEDHPIHVGEEPAREEACILSSLCAGASGHGLVLKRSLLQARRSAS